MRFLLSMPRSQQIVMSFAPADRPAAATVISGLIDGYRGRELERVLGAVLAMADGDRRREVQATREYSCRCCSRRRPGRRSSGPALVDR